MNREHHDQIPASLRFAEKCTDIFGSVGFIITQTIIIGVWIGANIWGWIDQWDPYPFILLNLGFSMQAAYAAPLILLATNRSAQKDRIMAEFDYQHNARSLALLEGLHRDAHGQTCGCLTGLDTDIRK